MTSENYYCSYLLKKDILENEEEINSLNISDDENYFFCPIGAFENLMYLLGCNAEKFEFIINEKLCAEKELKNRTPVKKEYSVSLMTNINIKSISKKSSYPYIDIEHILLVNKAYYPLKKTMGNNHLDRIKDNLCTEIEKSSNRNS